MLQSSVICKISCPQCNLNYVGQTLTIAFLGSISGLRDSMNLIKQFKENLNLIGIVNFGGIIYLRTRSSIDYERSI